MDFGFFEKSIVFQQVKIVQHKREFIYHCKHGYFTSFYIELYFIFNFEHKKRSFTYILETAEKSKSCQVCEKFVTNQLTNEAYTSAKDKETVDGPDFDVLLRLFPREAPAIPEHIDKGTSDNSIDVENEIGLLGRRDLLDFQRVQHQGLGGETLEDVFLDQLDSHVRIVDGFDSVADAHDELSLFARVVDELLRMEARVVGFREHSRRAVQRAAESVTLHGETKLIK